MSKLIVVAMLLAMTGCAAWTTPSTYTNHNTPNGNVVTAQGKAAENAAYSNTSHNCPSCTGGNTQSSNGSGYYDQYGMYHQVPPSAEEQFINGVKVDLYNNLRWMISSKTIDALY